MPASALLALMLFSLAAAASGALSWSRSSALERDRYPALHDRRQLRMWATEARFVLQGIDSASRAERVIRADGIASRFHALASDAAVRDGGNPALRAVDDRFTVWFVDARRAAQGLSSGEEATASSADLGAAAYRRLDEQLASEVSAASSAIERDAMLAERGGALAWSLAGLALVCLVYGLAAGRTARVAATTKHDELSAFTPAPRRGAWTQPVRATPAGPATRSLRSANEVPSAQRQPSASDPELSPTRRATDRSASRTTATTRYEPGWGVTHSLMPQARAAGRPVALYDAIRVLEQVLRDTSAGLQRAEAPLEMARSSTRSTGSAATRLATTAAALAVEATKLQTILGSFRVTVAA